MDMQPLQSKAQKNKLPFDVEPGQQANSTGEQGNAPGLSGPGNFPGADLESKPEEAAETLAHYSEEEAGTEAESSEAESAGQETANQAGPAAKQENAQQPEKNEAQKEAPKQEAKQEPQKEPEKGETEQKPKPPEEKQETAPEEKDAPTETHPTLQRGNKGPEVKKLQQVLNSRGQEPPLAVDGIFGGGTEAAVKKFQRSVKLSANGVVNADTWTALDKQEASPDIAANDQETGEHIKERMDVANEGPYGLDVGIHYSYNFEYECKKSGHPGKWKDDYRTGYADPTYFVKQGFMDWSLKPRMSASAAIKSWLRGLTIAECNSSVVAMEIDALRAAIGDKKFDEKFGSTDHDVPEDARLRVKPGTDGTPVANFMKSTETNDLFQKKKEDGKDLTDKDLDDTLKVGEWYYFYNHPKYLLKHPGGAWQGENSVYMGRKGGQRIWSGLGASNVSEESMYVEMVEAYNAPRDENDERAMMEGGMKNADGTYNDPLYDPKGGQFPAEIDGANPRNSVTKPDAFTIGGVTRKGGFLADAGMALDVEKIKTDFDVK